MFWVQRRSDPIPGCLRPSKSCHGLRQPLRSLINGQQQITQLEFTDPLFGHYPTLDAPKFSSQGAGQPRSSLAPKFSLPKKKLSYPAVIFEGQLRTRNAPGTSYQLRALPDPRPGSAQNRLRGSAPPTFVFKIGSVVRKTKQRAVVEHKVR